MSSNPIRGTVSHFMEAGALRRLRKEARKQKPQVEKAKKSNFVRFFESLENRGPLTPHSTYEKWTKAIHKEMEAAETWPKGKQECDLRIIAEYISRLQLMFWKEYPELQWYTFRENIYGNHWEEFLPNLRVFRKIYNKIRNKGLRDRKFYLPPFDIEGTLTWTWISWRFHPRSENQNIRPFTPFTNHGDGI
jgi:hypothetical protein